MKEPRKNEGRKLEKEMEKYGPIVSAERSAYPAEQEFESPSIGKPVKTLCGYKRNLVIGYTMLPITCGLYADHRGADGRPSLHIQTIEPLGVSITFRTETSSDRDALSAFLPR